MRSPCCLCIPLLTSECLNQSMKLGTYIMAPESISTAYFINLCLYVYPPTTARQCLGKNVTMAMNTHATIVELLDASFSMWSMS
jgi:hypothetical protein